MDHWWDNLTHMWGTLLVVFSTTTIVAGLEVAIQPFIVAAPVIALLTLVVWMDSEPAYKPAFPLQQADIEVLEVARKLSNARKRTFANYMAVCGLLWASAGIINTTPAIIKFLSSGVVGYCVAHLMNRIYEFTQMRKA